MKRLLLTLVLLFPIVFYFACRKNDTYNNPVITKNAFLDSASAYLKTQLSSEEYNALNFNNVSEIKKDGHTECVFIPQADTLNKKMIALAKQNGKFLGNWLTYTADASNMNGSVVTESFKSDDKKVTLFTDGRPVQLKNTLNGITKTTLIKYSADGRASMQEVNAMGVQLTETGGYSSTGLPNVSVSYTSYNSSITYASLYWLMNQDRLYYYSYFPNVGGGSSANTLDEDVPMVFSPDISVDIFNELKCFTSNASSKCYVTVYVNEPLPKTRALVNI